MKKLILNFKPGVLSLDFAQRCFMRDRTHSYLWLRDELGEGLFLSIDPGQVAVVRVPRLEGSYQVRMAGELFELVPIGYDFKQAVRKYWESTLGRTAEAEAEMRAILGVKGEFKRPEPVTPQPQTKKAPKEPSSNTGGGYSLTELCASLKIDPSDARKALRGKVEKPGSRWEWTSATCPEVLAVRKILESL